jgi:hypothetical protein
MTPEIRAAVKALVAAFKVIVEALAQEATPKPKPPSPPTPPPGHTSHLVVNRRDGLLDFCCEAHEAAFEANVQRYGQPQRSVDVLSTLARRYIRDRLGGQARDFPGPRWYAD